MGKKPLKKVKDGFESFKKSAKRMAKTTSKNIGNTTKKSSKTIRTNTGRIVNIHGKKLVAGAAGLAVGMTMAQAALLFTSLKVLGKEPQVKGMDFDEYLEIANNNPENLSDEDWQNIITQTSRRLERQLRLILDIDDIQNFDLIAQLDLAKEKEIFGSDEIDKLHRFRRDVRNPIMHAKKDKVGKYEIKIIVWTANFVKNLEDEEITNIE